MHTCHTPTIDLWIPTNPTYEHMSHTHTHTHTHTINLLVPTNPTYAHMSHTHTHTHTHNRSTATYRPNVCTYDTHTHNRSTDTYRHNICTHVIHTHSHNRSTATYRPNVCTYVTHTHTHNVSRSNTIVNKTSHPQTSQSKCGPMVRRHADQATCSTTDRIVFLFSPISTPAPSPTPLQPSI